MNSLMLFVTQQIYVIGYNITWTLHQIFMYSSKAILAAGLK